MMEKLLKELMNTRIDDNKRIEEILKRIKEVENK